MTGMHVPPPTRPICDFCSAPEVHWSYPTTDFTMATDGERDWGSHGGWAACTPCYRLIERGDREALVQRSVKRELRLHPELRQVSRKQLARTQRELMDKFWASRKGDPVETNPDNPIDPTREDAYGRMMREDGQTMAIETERPEEVRRPDATISKDAVESMASETALWVMTRIMRRWHETGEAPQKVSLEVRVRVDDEPGQGGGERFVVPIDVTVPLDGERRGRARG